jgi:hypothetical protein
VNPAAYEFLILTGMALSGISVGLLFKVERTIPLVAIGFGASIALRALSAFFAWSIGAPQIAFDSWVAFSALSVVAAAALRWRHWKPAAISLALFEVLGLIALAIKYVLAIGERHHSDSANTVSLALISIQSESNDLSQLALSFKRGIAYPLMLGLGPEGRIFSAFTPLVMIVTLIVVTWAVWMALPANMRGKGFWISASAIGAFSFSVPMFRASFTYLNGHTLMGFGLALMLVGLLRYRLDRSLTLEATAFLTLGGIIGATARVEGIALVAIFLAATASEELLSTLKQRIHLFTVFAASGLALTWWLGALNSPVLERFGVSEWLLVAATVGGSALVATPVVDSLRRFILPVGATALGVLLIEVIATSGNPLGMILAQWPNLGLGVGGWATAAHMFIGSIVLLGLRSRSPDYRRLLLLSVLTLGAVLFTKTFDGGFGRASFYDSVNRMWLHAMPLIYALTLMGYSELMSAFTKSDMQSSGQSPRIRGAKTPAD